MKMKRLLVSLIIMLSVITFGVAASVFISQETPKQSKVQPKKVKLDADSLDDKWGEVAFDHETHALRNYNPDGKTITGCIECHHTDQPKENLKPPRLTSERSAVLTAELLKDDAAPPVKTCRVCHLQAGDDSKPLPVIKKDEKDLKLDNEVAYHTNCFVCHDAAIKARPELANKIAGSDPKGCVKCHVAK